MLLNGRNKTFFRVDSLPYDDNNGIYLTQVENEEGLGLKMTGVLPVLWEFSEKITGPNLYDENYTYRVVQVDYQNNLIWLEQF